MRTGIRTCTEEEEEEEEEEESACYERHTICALYYEMDGEKFRRRCSSTLQIRQNAVIKIVPDVTDSSGSLFL
ncbi:hypothetical protein T07_1467 [Trichinella nelsoni]|uniref:Uncharacterized protein n=1 Tax=Trichinella nelsoni TaxID=6336 RepID=A0A0V0S9P8_9BILA|nr:hypothetical protein T07_1467 [Trichinella nelsoni]